MCKKEKDDQREAVVFFYGQKPYATGGESPEFTLDAARGVG